MTVFAGNLMLGADIDTMSWNPGYGSKNTVWPDPWLYDTVPFVLFGSLTDNAPVTIHGQAQTGDRMGDQYGWNDWFNRIHIQYTLLDLGNLLSSQIVTVEVFSTYFEDRILIDVIPFNDAGLVLTPPSAYPITFLPWDSQLFELAVSTAGPPTIDALYTFDFDVIDLEMRVIGTRIVIWAFLPDWRRPIMERLEWMTSLHRAYSGREQRMKLRSEGPRAEFEFSFNVHHNDANVLKHTLYDWQSRIWALPIFSDGTMLTAEALSGGSTVPCDTTTRDFHDGGLAMICNHDASAYETFEIATGGVAAGALTAVLPLTNTWPQYSGIFPVRSARLSTQQPLKRVTAAGVEGVAQFKLEESIERTAATETLYRGMPLLTEKPNWREGLGYDFERMIEELDNMTNPARRIQDGSNLSIPKQHYLWSCANRTEAEALRQFLYARQGRWKSIWVPTFDNDLRLANDLTAVEVNMDVEWCGASAFLAGGVHRRDIRIELWTGAIYYRRVSGFVQVDAETERMTLNTALGVAVLPADVKMISWMMLARLDQDSIELTWRSPVIAEASFVMAGFNNAV